MALLLDLLLSPPADFACLLLTDGDPVHFRGFDNSLVYQYNINKMLAITVLIVFIDTELVILA